MTTPCSLRRYWRATAVARRLGVPVDVFLQLYGCEALGVPRPIVVNDRPRWDMVRIEYWLDTACTLAPPSFEAWLAANPHRAAPYEREWSLLAWLGTWAGSRTGCGGARRHAGR
jgi:hypothetical protein